ncbi:hypothetical protein TSOC_001609 [Tetrabaena socialis]|uniref:GmrSD restriction endonucleases N-terminal domain-containing protein n=1 Tax=Tetrabaena socialis TaxID=47790 RepID=A0A2J8AG62_9CHLO|nr:hypothetical protein TSOC_001609 [Tetrabaena socialis]|eukprot:PNH11515.1 hypothetical protein TSOC_001609 [Tetrabaena socialis]
MRLRCNATLGCISNQQARVPLRAPARRQYASMRVPVVGAFKDWFGGLTQKERPQEHLPAEQNGQRAQETVAQPALAPSASMGSPKRDFLEARQVSLYQLFDSSDFKFDIPTYQRPYAWRSKQIFELLQDFVKAYQSRQEYFLGAVVATKAADGAHVPYQLIDGQQRMTSLVILLAYLHGAARQQGNEVLEGRIRRMLYLEEDPLDPASSGRAPAAVHVAASAQELSPPERAHYSNAWAEMESVLGRTAFHSVFDHMRCLASVRDPGVRDASVLEYFTRKVDDPAAVKQILQVALDYARLLLQLRQGSWAAPELAAMLAETPPEQQEQEAQQPPQAVAEPEAAGLLAAPALVEEGRSLGGWAESGGVAAVATVAASEAEAAEAAQLWSVAEAELAATNVNVPAVAEAAGADVATGAAGVSEEAEAQLWAAMEAEVARETAAAEAALAGAAVPLAAAAEAPLEAGATRADWRRLAEEAIVYDSPVAAAAAAEAAVLPAPPPLQSAAAAAPAASEAAEAEDAAAQLLPQPPTLAPAEQQQEQQQQQQQQQRHQLAAAQQAALLAELDARSRHLNLFADDAWLPPLLEFFYQTDCLAHRVAFMKGAEALQLLLELEGDPAAKAVRWGVVADSLLQRPFSPEAVLGALALSGEERAAFRARLDSKDLYGTVEQRTLRHLLLRCEPACVSSQLADISALHVDKIAPQNAPEGSLWRKTRITSHCDPQSPWPEPWFAPEAEAGAEAPLAAASLQQEPSTVEGGAGSSEAADARASYDVKYWYDVQRTQWHSKLGNLVLLPSTAASAAAATADYGAKAALWRQAGVQARMPGFTGPLVAPEGRYGRFSFCFDECRTRHADMLEQLAAVFEL